MHVGLIASAEIPNSDKYPAVNRLAHIPGAGVWRSAASAVGPAAHVVCVVLRVQIPLWRSCRRLMRLKDQSEDLS
jgi:hypothetical protein